MCKCEHIWKPLTKCRKEFVWGDEILYRWFVEKLYCEKCLLVMKVNYDDKDCITFNQVNSKNLSVDVAKLNQEDQLLLDDL